MPRDRMFNVLVLGGIALVGASACGGTVSAHADAGSQDSGFPSELPVQGDAAAIDSGFPSEAGGMTDSDAGLDTGFPTELPVMVGPDAAASDAAVGDAAGDGSGFPAEQ